MSPVGSQLSLYQQGRCTNVYDYGFGKQYITFLYSRSYNYALRHIVHPYGSRTSPGSIGAVPEVLFSEIEKVKFIPQTSNPYSRRSSPNMHVRVWFSHYTLLQFLCSAFTQGMVLMVASGSRHTGEGSLWSSGSSVPPRQVWRLTLCSLRWTLSGIGYRPSMWYQVIPY